MVATDVSWNAKFCKLMGTVMNVFYHMLLLKWPFRSFLCSNNILSRWQNERSMDVRYVIILLGTLLLLYVVDADLNSDFFER